MTASPKREDVEAAVERTQAEVAQRLATLASMDDYVAAYPGEWGERPVPCISVDLEDLRTILAALSRPEGEAGAGVALDREWVAATVYKHFCDVHGLHPDEAADSTGELLDALSLRPVSAVPGVADGNDGAVR